MSTLVDELVDPTDQPYSQARGRSPTISVSILGSVGPVGTVAPELQASQAGFLPE